MKRWRELSDSEKINQARDEAYSEVCPPMNRKERRTAKGRMLVAMGEAAALRAENEFIRSKLFQLGYVDD